MGKKTDIFKRTTTYLLSVMIMGSMVLSMNIRTLAAYETYEQGEFTELGKFHSKLNSSEDWNDSDYDLEDREKYIITEFHFDDYSAGEKKLLDPEGFIIIGAKDIEGNELLGEDETITPYLDMPKKELEDSDITYYNEALSYESGSYAMVSLLFKVPQDAAEVKIAVYVTDDHTGEPEAAFVASVGESYENYEPVEVYDEEDE